MHKQYDDKSPNLTFDNQNDTKKNDKIKPVYPPRIKPDEEEIFDTQVIFLVDSNLKIIVVCEFLLNKVDMRRNLDKIFIHCSTNHIYQGEPGK